MVYDNPFPFIICYDGYFLIQDICVSGLSDTKIKFGVEELTMVDSYAFPTQVSIIERLEPRNLFEKFVIARRASEYYLECAKKTRSKAVREKNLQGSKAAKMVILGVYEEFKQKEKGFNSLKGPLITLTPEGIIAEQQYRYELTDQRDSCGILSNIKEYKQNITLPSKGNSRWIYCCDSEKTAVLEAAMMATASKEELLDVLRKTRAITGGKWVTLKQFIVENDIAAMIGKKYNDLFSEVATAITNFGIELQNLKEKK